MNIDAFLTGLRPLLTVNRFSAFILRHREISWLGPVDPCPDVKGMASPRKLRMLNIAVSLLPADQSQCYCEIGTFIGKSLIGALINNPQRCAIACDNFSQFDSKENPQNHSILMRNLQKHGLAEQVRFHNGDFPQLFADWNARGFPPIGVYFYDGAHDEENQFQGIRLAEQFLADEALVLVDDWRFDWDSGSYAKEGTLRAVGQSKNQWTLMHELPAKFNGDKALWWNGVGVLSFKRRKS
jgi:predicted O-methyltransferase YrrM